MHYIVFPERYDSLLVKLDILHELTHALLAETISPAFSGGKLALLTERGGQIWRDHINDPVQVATDWFIDGWFMKEAPDLAKEYLAQRINEMLVPFVESRKLPTGNIGSDRFDLALLAAQSEKYRISSYVENIDDEELKRAVQVLLSVDECSPTLRSLLNVKNALVAVSNPDFCVDYDPPKHEWLLFERGNSSWSRI